MKVLWLVNTTFPEAEGMLAHNNADIQGTGGWLPSLANSLGCCNEIDLRIASFSSLVKEITYIRGSRCSFYVLPYYNLRVYQKEIESLWIKIRDEFKPDIVHVQGTEYTHGLSYINACGNHNVVVSIQGMPSVICDYMYAGLTEREIRSSFTLKTILKGSLIKERARTLKHICTSEVELLSGINYVIGRTSWDKAHTWAINPHLHYFHCGEILRDPFYEGKWTYEGCNKHSMFLSQASRPLKGVHQLLKAMPIILRHYPDVKIRIAGDNVIDVSTWHSRIRLSAYGKILSRLIRKYKLNDIITFTGPLNAEKMKEEYLKANVFVSPSSIENSPNSLCEAQILGVPCVASYVGGTMDFIPNDRCGLLYRFDDIEMLAKSICDSFEKSVNYDNTEMRKMALSRHDKEKIINSQVEIYKKILG